jgi:hypothetical protein
MRTLFSLTILLSAFTVLAVGCDLAKPQGRTQPTQTPESAEGYVPPVGVSETGAETPINEPQEPAAQPEKQPEEPKTVRVEAKAGVTGKGQYGQGGGEKVMDIITVPVGEYWRTKERLVFDIQIPQAMSLYKASNENKAPADHDTFMKDIIEANKIKLPGLPSEHKYIYNPETESLEVEKPR